LTIIASSSLTRISNRPFPANSKISKNQSISLDLKHSFLTELKTYLVDILCCAFSSDLCEPDFAYFLLNYNFFGAHLMSALHLCRRSCLGGACRKATRHLGWIATSESDLRVECSYISSLGLPRLITSIPIFVECISIPQRVLRTPKKKNQNDWKSEWRKGVRFLGLKYNILSRLPICCSYHTIYLTNHDF